MTTATARDVINFFTDLANRGGGVDKDGVYGYQCADVPTYAAKHWFGVDLWGNAADLLNSAEAVGWEVHREPNNEVPRAGAFFVMNVWFGGVNYGHTGLVISDSDGVTMSTIEQNLVGNLEVGSPAQYNTRGWHNIAGWFYPPYAPEDNSRAVEPVPASSVELIPEKGAFTVEAPYINVRSAPSLTAEIVAAYEEGEEVNYDHYVLVSDGHRWISWIGNSGHRRYLAIGPVDQNGRRTEIWGAIR